MIEPGKYGDSIKAHPFKGKMPPTPQPVPIKQTSRINLTTAEKKAMIWHLEQGKRLAKGYQPTVRPATFFADLASACEKVLDVCVKDVKVRK